MRNVVLGAALLLGCVVSNAQTTPPKAPAAPQRVRETVAPPPPTPTRAEILRGAYGPYRANNDLLSYKLDIRVDPVAKSIAGTNTVRFRMLRAGSHIQLDLTPDLTIDSVTLSDRPLQVTRDGTAVTIDFARPLTALQIYSVTVHYHGNPVSKGRFGGMSFDKDPAGRPWIFTADEDDGCSIWWPCKDQWRDEPQEGMDLAVAVPAGMTDVSNGRFVSKVDLNDGYTQWNWHVSYPINSYDVALNIGTYEHFSETYKNAAYPPLTLDFYALPEDLDRAKKQFAQAKGMLDAYEHYFGEYPFARDGYKLVQVPYSGMEHQSAVSYGNGFDNGYLHVDWTHVGISPRFDFIIIHESGHEWFGNAVTAQDRSDMWIHEGWTTYLETLYVEYQYGHADALKYISGLVPKVFNRKPIVTERGVNGDPPQDQYFKGALMLNTLRSSLDNDTQWFTLIKAFYQRFKYQNIMTEDVIAWWNLNTHRNLTPFFNQYLRRTAIPCLELQFDEKAQTVMYKWQADEEGFTMPVKVGDPKHWQTIHPTLEWQTMTTSLGPDAFKVATDLFYINVSKT
jgi:aminopeptidase N